ncbi:hypothetical protein RFI_12998, partial [Reticulomyxa filosa]
SELKKEIIKENSCFQYLFDEIENKIDIIKKNVLIESCLRSMWSCLLSRPSLKPYPLIFTSNPQLNHQIQSKKPEIAKEFLGKDSCCNDIGYFTWPSLIRCDTDHLLNVPIAVCYAPFNLDVNVSDREESSKNNAKPNEQIISENQNIQHPKVSDNTQQANSSQEKKEQTEKLHLLNNLIEQYKVQRMNPSVLTLFEIYYLVKNILRDIKQCIQNYHTIVFCNDGHPYCVAFNETIDEKNENLSFPKIPPIVTVLQTEIMLLFLSTN